MCRQIIDCKEIMLDILERRVMLKNKIIKLILKFIGLLHKAKINNFINFDLYTFLQINLVKSVSFYLVFYVKLLTFTYKIKMHRGYYSPPRYGISSQAHQRFPQDIQQVIKSDHPDRGNLFISNLEAAENHRTIQKYKIRAILSCAKGYQINHPQQLVPKYKYIPAEDRPSYDLTPYIEECVDFINENIRQHNILVHCIAGVSRSVSMVLAYLMRQHGMTYDQAYHSVKRYRGIINPNDGFIAQLRAYEKRLQAKRNSYYYTPHSKSISYDRRQFESPLAKSNYYGQPPNYYQNKTISRTSKISESPLRKPNMHYSNRRASWGAHNPEFSQRGYYDNQLDAKINLIRQRYNQQRQQLVSSRRRKFDLDQLDQINHHINPSSNYRPYRNRNSAPKHNHGYHSSNNFKYYNNRPYDPYFYY